MLTGCYRHSRWLLPSVSKFSEGISKAHAQPVSHATASDLSTGGAPFQPAEDASADHLLQYEQLISGIAPLVISILTGRKKTECINYKITHTLARQP